MRSLLVALILPTLAAGGESLFLVNAHVLAPSGDVWLDHHAVIVDAGRVIRVAPQAEMTPPTDAAHVDLNGLYLMPGLIDLHSHLLLHPYDEASWNDQVLKEPLGIRTIRAVTDARATLLAGFTTIRDLGTEGADFIDVSLRDAVARGMIDGPRIFAATRALVATGCYGPSGFAPRFDLPKGAQVADGVDGVRVATRQQIAAGADWIKVYADYRRRPGDPSTPTYSLDELTAIVDEAKSAGLPVAAHAATDEAIRRAVAAGVRTIEHGYHASLDTLILMRDQGVVLCPTLTASESIARYSGWRPGDPEPDRVLDARRLIERALEATVTIACGSDVGVFAHGDNARELELMVDYGMTAAHALRAATVTAAEVLGREDLGVLVAGATADLIAVAGDPLQDIRALRRVHAVIREGRLVRSPPPPDQRQILEACEGMLAAHAEQRFSDVRDRFTATATVTASRDGEEPRTLGIDAFLADARARPFTSFREWFVDSPTIRQDGPIAIVWTPYRMEVDGVASQGTDVFQLVREAGGWRIQSVAFTNRR